MLRRIRTSQLELGMFIHSMEGTWFDHPFWRTRFLLNNADQLEQLVFSDVAHVTIDESRGKELPNACQSDASSEPEEPTACPRQPGRVIPPSPIKRPRSYLRVVEPPRFNKLSQRERAAELRKASNTVKRSRAAVMHLFEEARLGNSIKSRELAPLVDQIWDSVSVDPAIILNIARLKTKDEYTYLHSVAVCALMINLVRKMGVPETQIPDVGMAGLLHDVGKMAIPDSILTKPGKLTEAEWAIIKEHPQRGHEILSASEGVSDIALEVCLRHHEKMDGTGYPGAVSADNLSIFSRMSAVCDVYDALTSQRPYNAALSASQALAKMQSFSGHFDQIVLREFADSLGILPIGTLVRLNQDELAVVIGESPSNYAAPIVRIFRSLDRDGAIPFKDIDIAKHKSRKLVGVEAPEDWGFSDWASTSESLLRQPPAL